MCPGKARGALWPSLCISSYACFLQLDNYKQSALMSSKNHFDGGHSRLISLAYGWHLNGVKPCGSEHSTCGI